MTDKPTMQPQPPKDDAAPERCDHLRDVVLTRARQAAKVATDDSPDQAPVD
ncbi:MAG: hypothetical protein NTV39_03060 [Candidatus Saccharibacteria bacterium]|nr:hypothetical protein [Candidatus Saccharibacteria bacterium]